RTTGQKPPPYHQLNCGADPSLPLPASIPPPLRPLASTVSFNDSASSLSFCLSVCLCGKHRPAASEEVMVAPPSTSLQQTLQAVVQSVQWTYSLFWQPCPRQGILVWGDGYYNGSIKTRKTVQPVEVSTEEASLQRSQQLRELYESLSLGEANVPARRPCAALSPEDLTEAEWFYLMCISFSFPPGVGQRHVWLTRANEVDSKVFSRAILAKGDEIEGSSRSELRAMKYSVDVSVPPGLTVAAAEAIPAAEASELMQLEMSEDIRVGSISDCSNNLDAEQMPAAQSICKNWNCFLEDLGTQEQDFSPEDAHYSETVSSVLRHNLRRWVDSSPFSSMIQSQKSAFSRWSSKRDRLPVCSRGSCTSQWLLKTVVLNIRDLHCKLSDGNSPKSPEGEGKNRFQKGAAQEEISANHVLAERRRREKLNESSYVRAEELQMDKASILGDTIEFVKQLKKRIQDLEARNRQSDQRMKAMEVEKPDYAVSYKLDNLVVDKRKLQALEGSNGVGVHASVEEEDALLELQCSYRDGLLLKLLQGLHELGLEVSSMHFSASNAVCNAVLRAKVTQVWHITNRSIDMVKLRVNVKS
ncbi:hypothetical protein BHM03_00061372, partial [Ensete ventricosum]